jgi:hypothetical protein
LNSSLISRRKADRRIDPAASAGASRQSDQIGNRREEESDESSQESVVGC